MGGISSSPPSLSDVKEIVREGQIVRKGEKVIEILRQIFIKIYAMHTRIWKVEKKDPDIDVIRVCLGLALRIHGMIELHTKQNLWTIQCYLNAFDVPIRARQSNPFIVQIWVR